MGILGGGGNQPQRMFNVRVNQSVYGMPLPVVMGTVPVQQSVLWVDGFSSKKIGGKGGKGGGKGGQYDYSADVVVALCNGPILGIGDVWSGQSWLGNPLAFESYTISSGSSYQYTPAYAALFYLLFGVSIQNAFSGLYSDFGSPSGTSLSGIDWATMMQVPYGTSLTTGLFSVNPTGNVFNFASADAGRTVQISYSYLLTTMNEEQTVIVPSGKTVSVGGVGSGSKVSADYGVRYTTTDVEFTKVSGTPSATGTYSVSGNNPATYKFATGDINAEVTITYGVNDPNAVSPGQAKSLNFTLNAGTQGQSPYSFLTGSYPSAAFGYTSMATLLYQPMDLGMGAQIQENRFEVVTADMYGGGIADCNPIQCLGQVLTNSVWGLGAGPVPFPASCIDNGTSGTWGGAVSTPGARQVGATAWNWFAAQNFFISPVIDGQDTAASVASKWLEAGMCAAFFSEGLLKLVPYGDTSAAANGVTWTAPSSYVVALDDTCFLAPKEGEDPVKISRSDASDAWNVVQIQWENRLNQYAPEITQESDQNLINRWGERREDPQNCNFIHTVTAATFAANMRVKRNSYDRNEYKFSLPYTYSYLEPMDIVPVTTSSFWAAGLNNLNLGITTLPVRITKIVDNPDDKGLEITAEDYVFGTHQPVLYNKQLNTSNPIANAFADPGSTEVVMFEAMSRLTGFQGDQIWIGALGTSSTWGSCNVWVSQDGTNYTNVGAIKNPAKLGVLHSTFSSGSDPDTVNSLVVDLATNCGSFEAFPTSDADNNVTDCFVDGEIVAYSALTYTGQNQITMGTYIRRGQMGSAISSHLSGGLFLALDGNVFKYTYDPTWRGQTLYFKFQSLNSFGFMAQDLSTLTPTSFTIPGTNPGSIDASSGLLLPSANPSKFIGAYSGSYAYVIGNEVIYSLNYYACIANTIGNLPTNATYWQLVANNTDFFDGAYSGSTAYVPGNQVTYSGNYYICILASTGNAPTNETYWQLISDNASAQSLSGTNLLLNGDFSNPTPGLNWAFPQTNPAGSFLTGVSGLPVGSTEFKTLASSNTWIQSLTKIPVDITKTYLMECWLKIPAPAGSQCYGGFAEYDASGTPILHQASGATYGYCLFDGTSTIGNTWQYFSAVINGSATPTPNANQFNSATKSIGAVFLLNYTGSTNQQVEITGISIVELSGSVTYLGAYSSSANYSINAEVSYLGNFWVAILPSIGQTPASGSSYWTLVGTSSILLGAWSYSTAYVAGNQVTYNGNIYTCTTANTNQTPSTTSSYWTLVGSQSLASIPVGGSLAKVAATAFTYSATTTSITLYWSNLTIYQVDGTILSLGSSSQAITGLTAGTAYAVFPYWNGASVKFVASSDVSGLQSLVGVSVAGSGDVTTATTFNVTNSSTHVSVEFWCYPTSGYGVCVGTSNGPEIELGLAGGSAYQVSVNGSGGSSGTVFGGTLTANFWNHVVVVFNYGGGGGGTTAITMYVNGVSSTGSQSVSSSPVRLGRLARAMQDTRSFRVSSPESRSIRGLS